MKIYFYDLATGVLKGEGEALPDPLEHELLIADRWKTHLEAGGDAEAEIQVEPQHWLVPANATAIAPLKPKAGFTQAFADGKWIRVKIEPLPADPEPAQPTWDILRRRAYGSYGDQLDMIYRQLKAAGLEGEYTQHIEAVKAAIPKPDAG